MTKHEPDLSLVFHALGDPTRRALLARLVEGPAPVSTLAEPTGFALPTVLRHLSVLEAAGLTSSEKSGRQRIFRAEPSALERAETWLSTQRRNWDARLDRLDAYIATLPEETGDE